MTNEEHARFTAALVAKAKRIGDDPAFWPTRDDWLYAMIGSAIADTVLVCEGSATIEQYEATP